MARLKQTVNMLGKSLYDDDTCNFLVYYNLIILYDFESVFMKSCFYLFIFKLNLCWLSLIICFILDWLESFCNIKIDFHLVWMLKLKILSVALGPIKLVLTNERFIKFYLWQATAGLIRWSRNWLWSWKK